MSDEKKAAIECEFGHEQTETEERIRVTDDTFDGLDQMAYELLRLSTVNQQIAKFRELAEKIEDSHLPEIERAQALTESIGFTIVLFGVGHFQGGGRAMLNIESCAILNAMVDVSGGAPKIEHAPDIIYRERGKHLRELADKLERHFGGKTLDEMISEFDDED